MKKNNKVKLKKLVYIQNIQLIWYSMSMLNNDYKFKMKVYNKN